MERFAYINKEYTDAYKRYGNSPNSVLWPKGRQTERFDSLLHSSIIQKGKNLRILDFGCGLGHLHDFLKENMSHNFKYTGVDINPHFVTDCVNRKLNVHLISDYRDIVDDYDVVVCSGVFNLKFYENDMENQKYINAIINHLLKKTALYFASDFMRTQVDYVQDNAWHQDLNSIAEVITMHTRKFEFDMTRLDYEYTIRAWK